MSSRQLTQIETDLLTKVLNFSITSKTLPDTIATIGNAGRDLQKEKADIICAKISGTLQNSKLSNDKLSKNECKSLKELQSHSSIVVLQADKDRSTVIINRKDYLEKCMDYKNNAPYQLLTKVLVKIIQKSKII